MANSSPERGANDGFVSSAKGITLSVVSLIIWTFTLLLFQMTDAIAKGKVSYQVFCLFTSFILSVIVGFYISRLMYRKNDKWRPLATFLNILLIYSSANGIQAGHAAMEASKSEDTGKPITQLALFGLLDARPWLRDATSKEEIKTLSASNKSLQIKNEGLTGQVSELQIAIKANDQSGVVQSLTDANQQLRTENGDLKNRVSVLEGQLRTNDQSGVVRNLTNTNQQLRTENSDLRKRVAILEGQLRNNDQGAQLRQLQEENRDLKARLDRLQAAIRKYNSIRSQWLDKAKADPKFSVYVSKFREGVTPYLGAGYYNQLFFYDLEPK